MTNGNHFFDTKKFIYHKGFSWGITRSEKKKRNAGFMRFSTSYKFMCLKLFKEVEAKRY